MNLYVPWVTVNTLNKMTQVVGLKAAAGTHVRMMKMTDQLPLSRTYMSDVVTSMTVGTTELDEVDC